MLGQKSPSLKIDRHRAAIIRADLSRPVRLALEAGLLTQDASFFDYGCGHGVDVKALTQKGFTSNGWDPHYFPNTERKAADIVNLGYVINVIEHEEERREALLKAWSLARKTLIVAAQVLVGEPGKGHLAYNDGVITNRNTFQKYYQQQELKNYIDSVLGTHAVPAGLGVYFVFRDETQAEAFRASRFRSRATSPRITSRFKKFDDYLPLLRPLMDFVTDRGRLPTDGELDTGELITKEFRSLKKAFQIIQRVSHAEDWKNIIERRRQDMTVYIALSRFDRRPKFTALPSAIQQDIKAFFGSYTRACETADKLLFSLGQTGVIAEVCKASRVGKLVGQALYVHISTLSELDPILRLYEGCASRTFGKLDEVTIIKFRTDKPKVSYLYYPDFDTDPHPSLHSSMQADLQGLYVNYRDYSTTDNPPILHRKETFVSSDYPLYEKFAKLTIKEENLGLLDNPSSIGTKRVWNEKLSVYRVKIIGHRLISTNH